MSFCPTNPTLPMPRASRTVRPLPAPRRAGATNRRRFKSEAAAARLAASRATAEHILAIESAFRAMSSSLPGSVEDCCQHDLMFHELIIAAAGNRLLVRIAAAIRTALLAAFRLSSNARESYENSLAEHWAVAAAIRRRDPDQAEQAMRALLAGTARDLAPAYEGKPARQASRAAATRRTGARGT